MGRGAHTRAQCGRLGYPGPERSADDLGPFASRSLFARRACQPRRLAEAETQQPDRTAWRGPWRAWPCIVSHMQLPGGRLRTGRSEEHTSELQSLMRISYAVFCLKKKRHTKTTQPN